MKINSDFRLRRADNKNFVVAVGEKSKSFSNTVKLNDTAAEIFKNLKNDKSKEEIAKQFENDYGILYENALNVVVNVIEQFKKAGFFDD